VPLVSLVSAQEHLAEGDSVQAQAAADPAAKWGVRGMDSRQNTVRIANAGTRSAEEQAAGLFGRHTARLLHRVRWHCGGNAHTVQAHARSATVASGLE
jgi:hypothetical protein